MNKELIRRLALTHGAAGRIALMYNGEDIKKLRRVLINAFPEDPYLPTGNEGYYHSYDKNHGFYYKWDRSNETNIPVYPLSDFLEEDDLPAEAMKETVEARFKVTNKKGEVFFDHKYTYSGREIDMLNDLEEKREMISEEYVYPSLSNIIVRNHPDNVRKLTVTFKTI